ncbi:MAG: glycosyltransferase [Chthoniobacteraceae bacterium]|nr:glycosyltransferase [Chthoniobacteraceae bacterium]
MDNETNALLDPLPRHLGIVCPMANELQTAERFVTEVLARCGGFEKVSFFAVLDNVSRDGTRALLDKLAASEPRLQPIWAPENRCVVDAYVRGYRAALDAGCDWILEIDAGFSHQPSDIPPFFEKMREGYDCVFATRFRLGGRIEDSSFKRYLVSLGGTILARLLLGTRLSDMTSGFELFRAPALTAAMGFIQSRGPFFQTEIKTYCHRYRIAEVPILYKSASHNVNNASLKDAFANLGRLFRLRLSGDLPLS